MRRKTGGLGNDIDLPSPWASGIRSGPQWLWGWMVVSSYFVEKLVILKVLVIPMIKCGLVGRAVLPLQ